MLAKTAQHPSPLVLGRLLAVVGAGQGDGEVAGRGAR
jgi:hypothetical protein